MSEKTYRIGEAAAKLNLKTYVLRFWEMEFPQIAPIRTEKGQRLYREADIAVLRRIRYLLHERGLTIEGARRLLREESERGETYADTEMALPENFVDEADDGGDGPDDPDAPDDESESLFDAEEQHPGPSPANGGVSPVQGSLFPLPAAPVERDHFSPDDLRIIILELTAIRALLGTGATGDIS